MKYEDGYLIWEHGKIPVKLFKYMTTKYLDEILKTNSMVFHNPKEFNDPFDCNYRIKFPKDFEKTKEFLRNTDMFKSGTIPAEMLEPRAKYICNNYNFFVNDLNKTMDKHISKIGVSCFTSEDNNLRLWGLYADKHKGVCLGFDISKDEEFFATTHSVVYVDEYPEIDYYVDVEQSFNKIVVIKHSIWSDEKEYRIVKKPNEGRYFFNKTCLTDIIFGYNLRDDAAYKENIIKIVKENGYPNVKFKQAYIMKDKFDVSYEVIE